MESSINQNRHNIMNHVFIGRIPSSNNNEANKDHSANQNQVTNKDNGIKAMATLKVVNHGNIKVEYKIMDINKVNASHLPNSGFAKNLAYPYENERRYHAENDSQAKVLNQALELDPEYLLDNRTPTDGAPIVDNQGNVLGGNGRSMAIMVAYEKNTRIIANYKQAIVNFAIERNLPYSGINKPILVREISANLSKVQAQDLISALNQNGTQALDQRTLARSRGLNISDKTIIAMSRILPEYDTIREFFDATESRNIVDMLVNDGVIPETDKIKYIDSRGFLNPEGKTFIEAALRSRIFSSYEGLSKLPASIITKLDACLPFILACQNIKKWDMSSYITECFELYFEYLSHTENNISVFLTCSDIITCKAPIDKYSLIAQILFLNFAHKTKKELVSLFKSYRSQASKSKEVGSMLIYGKDYADAIADLLDIPACIMTDNAYRIGE